MSRLNTASDVGQAILPERRFDDRVSNAARSEGVATNDLTEPLVPPLGQPWLETPAAEGTDEQPPFHAAACVGFVLIRAETSEVCKAGGMELVGVHGRHADGPKDYRVAALPFGRRIGVNTEGSESARATV